MSKRVEVVEGRLVEVAFMPGPDADWLTLMIMPEKKPNEYADWEPEPVQVLYPPDGIFADGKKLTTNELVTWAMTLGEGKATPYRYAWARCEVEINSYVGCRKVECKTVTPPDPEMKAPTALEKVAADRAEIVAKVTQYVDREFKGNWSAAFDHFDRDRDEKLSRDEVMEVLGAARIGYRATRWAIATQIVQTMDGDGDGKVSYAEFAAITDLA
jgi:hypothetical protein